MDTTRCPDFNWVKDFAGESDRGCVLISQAILEERLGDLIVSYLLETEGAVPLFLGQLRLGRSNPLGSFQSCIDYATRLKLIDKPTKTVFEKINKMRVEFAHYDPPRRAEISDAQAKSIFELLTDDQKTLAVRVQACLMEDGGDKTFPEHRRCFMAVASILILCLESAIQSSSKVVRTRSTPSTATQ